MLEIARNQSSTGVFQKHISLNQSISNKYLDHIIHALKTSGLIANVKGKKSGYLLNRDPEQITVLDIHKSFEPDLCLVECLSDNYNCPRNELCEVQGFWKGLNKVITGYMDSVTLADLMKHPDLKNEILEKAESISRTTLK